MGLPSRPHWNSETYELASTVYNYSIVSVTIVHVSPSSDLGPSLPVDFPPKAFPPHVTPVPLPPLERERENESAKILRGPFLWAEEVDVGLNWLAHNRKKTPTLRVLRLIRKKFLQGGECLDLGKKWIRRRRVDNVERKPTSPELFSTASSLCELNCTLGELSRAGRIEDARNLFDEMPRRDEYTWNTMIGAYAGSGRLAEARGLFEEAPSKSSITWSSLISGFARLGHADEAFRLFGQMQLEGRQPSQFTLGSVLRACSMMGLLRKGEQIHGYAIKMRFDLDDFVVTGLVDMYAKCKLIIKAECLFETVPEKGNPVLWTAMVTGYSQSGYGFKAMKCFRDMRSKGIQPNQYTFPSVLTACGAVSASDFGAQVHCSIVQSGFGTSSFVQSALIDMYSKCGNLGNAKIVLETMEIDDVVSWNTIIVGFVRHGFKEEALSLFKQMRENDVKIDHFTYPSVLNSFASSEDSQTAKSIHCMIIKTGFEAYKLVSNALIDMYAKQSSMDLAFKVFGNMLDRDVISWTSLITGYAFNGSYEEAIRLYCNMRISGIDPDEIVLSNILSSCGELTVLELGQQFHADFIKSGLSSSLSVDNSLVTMYAKCGNIEAAKLIFDAMENRNVISWTALIVGYAQN
ncbi:hypothetical protein CRG98_030764, partial [Punica granatum]